MPYSIVRDGERHCVVKKSDGKKMGCHPSREEAMKQMQALHANEAMSNLLWVDPFAYKSGEPFRVFPLGVFKRGGRTIDLTEQRLREMESNYNAKRPRWEIPIYFGHPTETNPDPPKGGNVKRVEFRPGDGLYAYPEYTDEAKRKVENGEYQYISPGVLWSLGGSVYSDENGEEHDNVIDHIALTNRPFFGRRTAIFSSEESLIKEADTFSQFREWISDLFRELVVDERKKLTSSGSGTSGTPEKKINEELSRESAKEKSNMADNVQSETFDAKTKVEELTIQLGKQADEFKAQMKSQQDMFEAEKKRADEFATQLALERKTRRLAELRQVADGFSALPIKSEEFADKFYALEQVNSELAKWFTDKFAQFNTDLAAGDLFSQVSRPNARKSTADVETVETLAAKIQAEEFKADKTRYTPAEALLEAAKRKPQLADKHLFSSKSVIEE